MKKTLAFAALCLFGLACKQQEKKPIISPPGYNLSNPEKRILDEDLDEVSGIFYSAKDSTIVTLNDEEGKFYRLNLQGKIIGKPFKFAKKSDFEDLTTDGSFWYAVKSDGEVHRIEKAFTDSPLIRIFSFPEKGWEFETIFFDASRQKIVLISKTPLTLKDGGVPAFSLDTSSGTFNHDPYYSPDTLNIAKLYGKKKWACKPTAAAVHPITGETYILSSNERMLMIMKDGSLNAIYHLDKSMFRQPEGITFMPNGNLMISNEAQGSTANILIFAYKQQE
ncbi:MAG: SdiA-regulated domain-containing protein [Chitinophagaceae bacterium]